MQSCNEPASGFAYKPSIVQKTTLLKGKENGLNAPTCLQPGKLKTTLENLAPRDTPKSRLPVPSKGREPIDFQKLHQSWENQFQKGKAAKKKSCTRPQPFNFSQKRDRSEVTTNTEQSANPQASLRRREPLAEVTFAQKNLNQEAKEAYVKGGSEEFKADPAALASILTNVGVPVAAAGKLSLAQRVPMRGSSIARSSNICQSTMVRSSMYALPRSQPASFRSDRMSCFPKMQSKVNDQNPVFKQNSLLKSHVPESNLKELVASKLGDEQQSQENPVLQQMNHTGHAQTSNVTSPPFQGQADTTVKSTPANEDGERTVLPADKCDKCTSEVDSSALSTDTMKKAASVEFVADSQALASILSNTGVAVGNGGKLSLAQRVPVQNRNLSIMSVKMSSGPVAMQVPTPKPCFGRMSNMPVSLKDVVFSPCRVPKTLMTDQSLSGSAKRVHQLNSTVTKFSQGFSVNSKQPFFPKTPRSLALEMANKKLEAQLSDTRPTARSTVRWADDLSPSMTEALCENEPKIEQVAVRLFLDGECPGEADKKKERSEESDDLKGSDRLPASIQQTMEAVLPKNSPNHTDVAAPACVPQDLPIRTHMHPPAPVSLTSTAEPPVQYSSNVSSLPFSFLSHPAVQALQSRTLESYSLPDIARLRIQAAVSAKRRFWETCLDEECAFYTSRGSVSSSRSCSDPVSSFLERQEDLHFTPIIPGDL